MKYANLDKYKRILGWYDKDINYKIFEKIVEITITTPKFLVDDALKEFLENLVENNKQSMMKEDETITDVSFSAFENDKLMLKVFYKISTIPEDCIEVSDEVWREAIDINANYYDENSKTFIVKDFRTLDELKALKIKKINIELLIIFVSRMTVTPVTLRASFK